MAETTNKEDFKRKFGDRVRQLREQKGFTKTSLADIMGIERQDVYKIERGIRNATLETIFMIAAALEISPADLFDFNGQAKNSQKKNLKPGRNN